MPRTKRLLKENNSENIKPNKPKLVRDMVNSYIKEMDKQLDITEFNMESKYNHFTFTVDNLIAEHCLTFRQWGNKTIKELKIIKPMEHTTLYERSVKNVTMNSTRGPGRKNRSISLENKANSQNASNTTVKKGRSSRSVTRANQLTFPFSTPLQQSTTSYGMITPKVKPNTPQIVLRRPKQGEIALSMQGSPLMVNHIVSEEKPNVNIPLTDGRVFSIQPERGLRASQIPDIDPQLRRQIETLRDNLSKVLNGPK